MALSTETKQFNYFKKFYNFHKNGYAKGET